MKITKILEGCHDSAYLLDVPVRRTYRQRKKNSCTNRLTLGLSMNFQNHFIFWMLIAQDTCSNKSNISVYVQQIFQKLKHIKIE